MIPKKVGVKSRDEQRLIEAIQPVDLPATLRQAQDSAIGGSNGKH